jgi:ABC-2 type transport system ATP-binding protein
VEAPGKEQDAVSDPILTENLTKRFRGVEALAGLDLQVPEGAIYALVGPNGAGKTTAIKILMNIFRPTSGWAKVLGTDSTKIAGNNFCSIGYVSENQKLPEWMRVDAFLGYLRPFYPTWDCELENELVTKFDLPRRRTLKQLSRGMRMKAALAGALAFRPKLIVLDEPLGGLDPLVRDELIEGLLDRADEATVFISSHDLAEIESFASHVGYLEQGRLIFSEPIGSLTARFREVELTLNASPALPGKYPASWLHLNASGAVVRFVDGQFDGAKTSADIAEVFGAPRNVTFTPMSLRSIFVAMARARRNAP